MFAASVRLVLRAWFVWFGEDARRIIRYLPPLSRRYGCEHFEGKQELLDRIGMPFAPKIDQDLRQAMSQDSGPVHPGMAAGAEGYQLSMVAGVAMMNI